MIFRRSNLELLQVVLEKVECGRFPPICSSSWSVCCFRLPLIVPNSPCSVASQSMYVVGISGGRMDTCVWSLLVSNGLWRHPPLLPLLKYASVCFRGHERYPFPARRIGESISGQLLKMCRWTIGHSFVAGTVCKLPKLDYTVLLLWQAVWVRRWGVFQDNGCLVDSIAKGLLMAALAGRGTFWTVLRLPCFNFCQGLGLALVWHSASLPPCLHKHTHT